MKTFSIIAVLFSIIILCSYGNNDAMKECEKTHSHNTCFYMLNR
jgi:hypothetical protein